MGMPIQVYVWSCPNFSALAGRPFRCLSDIWLLISGDAKVVCIYTSLSYSTIVHCVSNQRFEWYWKSKDVTQGNWVEMELILYLVLMNGSCYSCVSALTGCGDSLVIQSQGCKVMRTLVSVEIEIMLILRLPCCLSSSSVRCLEIAYLDGTGTESKPFEDHIETETHESPLTVAPPTSLPESTPPTLVPILCRTTRIAMHIPPVMSSCLSASMAEVTAMYESAFRKRFRSSYDSSPSLSPLDLPLRKRYRGTSELVDDSEDDDDEEDEEIEEGLDSDSVSEDAEDEGPTIKDEDPAMGDKGLAAGVEGWMMRVMAAPVVGTAVSTPLGLGYGELRRQELALEEDHVYSTFEVGQGSGSAPESERPERLSASKQPTLTTWTDPEDGMVYIDVPAYPPPAPPVQTPPSPEWTSGSLPISSSPSIVPLPVSSPMISLTVPSPIATPTTVEIEGFLTKLGAQVEMQGGLIRDHAVRLEELSPALFESLKYKQDRVAMTFGAIWRPMLALESWAGQIDAQREALWHAINDMQGENRDLLLQLTEERHARLELDEVVDSMRRGQEPIGDA
ncbi:hypothetical protein Tco_0351700 [Tanacetum coccineum]